MLSPQLLELLRDWWRIARPPVWMFPGRDRISPMTTRQLNRVCHMAAELASLPKWVAPHTLRHCFATHLLEQNIDIRVIQVQLLRGNQDEKTYCLTGECSRNLRRCLTKRAPVGSLILRPSRSFFFLNF